MSTIHGKKSRQYAQALDRPLPARAAAPFGSGLLGTLRLGAFAAMTAIAVPSQMVVLGLAPQAWVRLPRLYHRLTAALFGFEIEKRGEISQARPTLFVANHSSYLDITILGTMLKASFVAKTDVARWPVFGTLSRLQRTVFVDRRRGSAHRQRDDLRQRLAIGDSIVLFPEGTSSDGNRVLPFRSALMSAAERSDLDRDIVVQPVTITYTRINGLPLGRDLRPLVAWYGAMDLLPHLWRFASLGKVGAVVEFHQPVTIAEFGSRKELARHCADEVAKGLAAALAGNRQSDATKSVLSNADNQLTDKSRARQNDYTVGRTA